MRAGSRGGGHRIARQPRDQHGCMPMKHQHGCMPMIPVTPRHCVRILTCTHAVCTHRDGSLAGAYRSVSARPARVQSTTQHAPRRGLDGAPDTACASRRPEPAAPFLPRCLPCAMAAATATFSNSAPQPLPTRNLRRVSGDSVRVALRKGQRLLLRRPARSPGRAAEGAPAARGQWVLVHGKGVRKFLRPACPSAQRRV